MRNKNKITSQPLRTKQAPKMVAKMVNNLPKMVKVQPRKKATVVFEPNKSSSYMMNKVRKSGIQASKKAGLIRQIKKNKA